MGNEHFKYLEDENCKAIERESGGPILSRCERETLVGGVGGASHSESAGREPGWPG
jgi:hypothetical protein